MVFRVPAKALIFTLWPAETEARTSFFSGVSVNAIRWRLLCSCSSRASTLDHRAQPLVHVAPEPGRWLVLRAEPDYKKVAIMNASGHPTGAGDVELQEA